MIQKAIEYVVGLAEPHNAFIGGHYYSDRKLQRVDRIEYAEAIRMDTLDSFVEYINSDFDAHDKLFVHVDAPDRVRVFSELDADRKRETLAIISAPVPDFKFDTYMQHETFNVAVQSKFLPSADRTLLLKFSGTVENGSVAQYSDDGVTQKATIKTGIASKSDAILPNPVTLAAYRTFVEVPQPETQYIFRMKQGDKGDVQCALFEADGGAWMIEAKRNVKAYLAEKLKGRDDICIIS